MQSALDISIYSYTAEFLTGAIVTPDAEFSGPNLIEVEIQCYSSSSK
jgi:hypothetical protein